MSDYRTLNRTILAKVEPTPGTDSLPVVATDAVKVENPVSTPGLASEETNEVTGSLDASAAVPNGAAGAWSGDVLVKGSGAGGVAPEYNALLRSCGLAETLRAADLTGTAQAGAVGAITVAVGTGTGINIGETITTTGGTGSGQTRVITGKATDVISIFPDWTTTPDGTTTYAVKASALYVPATVGIAHSTIYDYQHSSSSGVASRLRKYTGWLGNLTLALPAGRVGRWSFNGQAKYVQPTDVTAPGAPTFDIQRATNFVSADLSLAGTTIKLNEMALDFGNNITIAPDPADAFGVDIGQIVQRRMTGRINPPMALNSERNAVTDFLAGTDKKLWVRYGPVGNAVSFYFPKFTHTGQEHDDVNGLSYEGLPFHAQGEDTGVYINIY